MRTCSSVVCGNMKSDGEKANWYFNSNGPMKMDPKWTLTIKVMARFAFAMQYVTPDDAKASVKEMVRLWGQSTQITWQHLVMLFVGHLIKWVPCYHQWILRFHALRPQTEQEVVNLMREIARWAHERRWPNMWRGMNSGLMHAQTGLAVNWGKLCLLDNYPAVDESRDVLRIGPGLEEYVVTTDDTFPLRVMGHVIESAKAVQLSWPAPGDDPMMLVNGVMRFANEARAKLPGYSTTKGLQGGKDRSGRADSYNVKHFARTFALTIESQRPDAFNHLLMQDIHKFCPDVKNYLKQFDEITGRDFKSKFARTPVMGACDACLWGGLGDAVLSEALTWATPSVMQLIRVYERDGEG